VVGTRAQANEHCQLLSIAFPLCLRLHANLDRGVTQAERSTQKPCWRWWDFVHLCWLSCYCLSSPCLSVLEEHFCDRRRHTFRSLALWLAKYRVCVGLTLRALLHTACCAGQVEGHRAGKDEGACTALAAPLSACFCLLLLAFACFWHRLRRPCHSMRFMHTD
jgi:hypothetical protein